MAIEGLTGYIVYTEDNLLYMSPKGHMETIYKSLSATCGTNGVGYKKCVLCGYTIKDVVISATGKHTYGDWVVDVEPTTSTEGIKSKHCSVCGHRSEITSIPCIK